MSTSSEPLYPLSPLLNTHALHHVSPAGPCREMAASWQEVAKAMANNTVVVVGEVDCAAHESLCSEAQIHAYPTIKAYKDGEEVR